jgi:hypothetical protein
VRVSFRESGEVWFRVVWCRDGVWCRVVMNSDSGEVYLMLRDTVWFMTRLRPDQESTMFSKTSNKRT